MPRASDTTKPITIYPTLSLASLIEALAAQERRSVNQQVLILLERAPELQEVANG